MRRVRWPPVPSAFIAADIALALALSNCCLVGSECARGGPTITIINDSAHEITVYVEQPGTDYRFGTVPPGEGLANSNAPHRATG